MSGIGCFVVFLILYYSGIHPLGNASWLSIWIPVVFICLSTSHYREHELEGFITYGAAYKTGFLTAMAGGVMYALLIYLFGTFIDATLAETYKTYMAEQLENTKGLLSESRYEDTTENLGHSTMSSIAFGDFFTKTLGGFIVSFVTAAVYKKYPPVFKDTVDHQ